MIELTQIEKDKIRFLKTNKLFNPIKLSNILRRFGNKDSRENFNFSLDCLITKIIQEAIEKCSDMDLPFYVFNAFTFTEMLKTSDLSEEYNGANIDVKVVNFIKNSYSEDYLVKYKVIGLDRTFRAFITLNGSFIPLHRVVKVNGKPFNMNDIINANPDKFTPKFRKEILKEPLYEFLTRKKIRTIYELFLKN